MKPPAAHHCSFCGRTPAPDSRLVAGPGVQICAECVRLCAEIMARDPPAPARPAARGPPGGTARLSEECRPALARPPASDSAP